MNETLCVLHLRASNFVGGPENQVLRYAEFDRMGPISVIVGTFVGPNEGQEFLKAAEARGFETWALPWGASSPVKVLWALRKFLHERKVSLLCTHGYRADVLGILAGRLSGVPVASFLRGWTRENRKVRLYEALNRFLLPLTTRVVCLSQTQADRLARRRTLRRKTRIVTNAIEARETNGDVYSRAHEELCRRYNLSQDSTLVAVAGRLSPEKGTTYFIQAVPIIRKAFPAARFIVFGDGPLRHELKRTAREICQEGDLSFAGHVPDFRNLFPGLDILVNPSLSEEMPNVVLESMAASVPVVATNVGGVAEIAGAGGLILIPPSDPAAIAQSVSALLRGRSRAKGQGRAGQKRVREVFSPERQREQLRALYNEMIPGLQISSANPENQKQGRGTVPSATQAENPMPFVSVVIPVRNEEAHLGSVVDQLLDQDYPPDCYEILVADGMSTDGTASVVDRYSNTSAPRVMLLQNPARLSSAGRNVGIRSSRGEIVCFIDGHCTIPDNKLLQETVRLFKKSGADCLCRPQPLNGEGNTFMQRVIAHARATALGHGTDSTIYAMDREGFVDPTSSGAVYRKSVFGRVGLYDERFDACEDVEFNHRVKASGMRAYSSPALAVYYRPRASLAGLFKQLARYGRGRFRFIRKHHDAFSIAQMIPAAFVAGLLAGGAAAIFSSPIRYAYLGVLALYGLTVLLFSARLGWRFGWGHFLAAPFVYATIHIALGVGFWEEAGAMALRLGRWHNLPETSNPVVPMDAPRADETEEGSADVEIIPKQTER